MPLSSALTKPERLTWNEMTVVAGSIGIHAKFVQRLDENPARVGNEDRSYPNAKDFAIDLLNLIPEDGSYTPASGANQ
jgi:Ca2+-transporting ATPase